MAIIPQRRLFDYKEIEKKGDLERLELAIESIPDEKLMRVLERERGKGRDKYSVRAMWNSVIALVVYQHQSVESLRRELLRNGQLRDMCGFYNKDVPGANVYSRFSKKLEKHTELICNIFKELVREIGEELGDLGKNLAIDGKVIKSLAKRLNKNSKKDGRRDLDADYTKKNKLVKDKNGIDVRKEEIKFGYKVHLVVDAKYELPVAYEVTKASRSEVKEAHRLIEKMSKEQPEVINKCQVLMADKGYDDEKLIVKLWDQYKIKPVIAIRKMHRVGDNTWQISKCNNIVYDYKGRVYCHCMKTEVVREMASGGFEEDRNSIKKICPAKAYGIKCEYMDKCKAKTGIRISIEENRRIFTPIDRSSYKWVKQYNKRSSVERVNSRLDESFGFEKHYIRGLKKMKLRVGISLCVMLGMAVGRIKEKEKEKMRSLIKAC